MPKAGNSKKRKRESKKDEDHGAKKAKSKENDGPHEEQEQDCTVVTNLSCEEQQEIDDIDEKLEQNAAKNNLTTINVKSILHVSLHMKTEHNIYYVGGTMYFFSIPFSVFQIMASLFTGRNHDLR